MGQKAVRSDRVPALKTVAGRFDAEIALEGLGQRGDQVRLDRILDDRVAVTLHARGVRIRLYGAPPDCVFCRLVRKSPNKHDLFGWTGSGPSVQMTENQK